MPLPSSGHPRFPMLSQALADSYTVSPFIGAVYVKGNFAFTTAPTLVMRWQQFDYNSAPGDDSSDITLVWTNTAYPRFLLPI